jgi:hypothetical protein
MKKQTNRCLALAALSGLVASTAAEAGPNDLIKSLARHRSTKPPRATTTTTVPTGNLIPGTNCQAFPSDSWFHKDISKAPVHPRSATWMANSKPYKTLWPEFGPSGNPLGSGIPYGMPITVVDYTHPLVQVNFYYASESDKVGYPLGSDTKIEGGLGSSADRHAIIVNKTTCRLYETSYTALNRGQWSASAGATWLLTSYNLRPDGWTSTDAAGLPLLPLLLRYEEVAAGKVDHAIRFTLELTANAHLWPARHNAGINNTNYPPMGARFRLKASYVINPALRADTKAVLNAMKKYGLVLADNGPAWMFGGTADNRWSVDMIQQLKTVPASAFEAVDTSNLMISSSSMRAR